MRRKCAQIHSLKAWLCSTTSGAAAPAHSLGTSSRGVLEVGLDPGCRLWALQVLLLRGDVKCRLWPLLPPSPAVGWCWGRAERRGQGDVMVAEVSQLQAVTGSGEHTCCFLCSLTWALGCLQMPAIPQIPSWTCPVLKSLPQTAARAHLPLTACKPPAENHILIPSSFQPIYQ